MKPQVSSTGWADLHSMGHSTQFPTRLLRDLEKLIQNRFIKQPERDAEIKELDHLNLRFRYRRLKNTIQGVLVLYAVGRNQTIIIVKIVQSANCLKI